MKLTLPNPLSSPPSTHGLTYGQLDFLADHEIYISAGYIGMLRAYVGSHTVWQTSSVDPIALAYAQGQGLARSGVVDWDQLRRRNEEALSEWVTSLMALSETELAARLGVHLPLF